MTSCGVIKQISDQHLHRMFAAVPREQVSTSSKNQLAFLELESQVGLCPVRTWWELCGEYQVVG